MGEKARIGLSLGKYEHSLRFGHGWRLKSTSPTDFDRNRKARRQVQRMKRWMASVNKLFSIWNSVELKYNFALSRGQNNTYGEFCLHLYHIVQTFCCYGFVPPVCYQDLFTSFSTALDYLDGYLSMIDWVTSLASYADNEFCKSAFWTIVVLPYIFFLIKNHKICLFFHKIRIMVNVRKSISMQKPHQCEEEARFLFNFTK